MALQKTISTKWPYDATYHLIANIEVNRIAKSIKAIVHGHESQVKRQLNKAPIYGFELVISGADYDAIDMTGDLTAQVYAKLKEHPTYSGAIDC